jgi:hypothetical protein
LELAYRHQGEFSKKINKLIKLLGLNYSASLIIQLYIYVFNFSDYHLIGVKVMGPQLVVCRGIFRNNLVAIFGCFVNNVGVT